MARGVVFSHHRPPRSGGDELEALLQEVRTRDAGQGEELEEFYRSCLRHVDAEADMVPAAADAADTANRADTADRADTTDRVDRGVDREDTADKAGMLKREGTPPENPHKGHMMDRGRWGCLYTAVGLYVASLLLTLVIVFLDRILDAFR